MDSNHSNSPEPESNGRQVFDAIRAWLEEKLPAKA